MKVLIIPRNSANLLKILHNGVHEVILALYLFRIFDIVAVFIKTGTHSITGSGIIKMQQEISVVGE